jgi:3-phosphoshikimate 1-carboxyvinyltransferase
MSRSSGPLQGRVRVPGDKSISHRSLIFGALAEGRTEVTGLLEAEDILCTAGALRNLGVSIQKAGETYVIDGVGLKGLPTPKAALDFGNSGTGARLMMGVVAGQPLAAMFTGDASLAKRPMGRVLDPLRKMGASVLEPGQTTLPLTLQGAGKPLAITYELPVPSAQVKSAILLAALTADGATTVIEPEATRDHTERMLGHFGIALETTPRGGKNIISLRGGQNLKGSRVDVPGDPSSAAFLAAAAVICKGSEIEIANVLVNETRTGFYTTLREMGASLEFSAPRELNGEPVADLIVTASRLRGVTVPAERAPSMIDEYPILAVVAAFAEGQTVMHGLAELRVKESDRLAAMVAGLNNCGATAYADGDTLIVQGMAAVPGRGAPVATHMDHRIAMAFLILGLAAENPVTVDDGAIIATSFPEFRGLVAGLGGDIADG